MYAMRPRTAVAAACAVSLIIVIIAAPTSAVAKKGGQKVTDPAVAVEKQVRDLKGILTSARSRLIGLAHLPSVLSANASACNADMAALPPLARYGSSGAADIQGNLFCLGIPFTAVSIADRAYFLRAIGTRELGVGDYQQGRVTGVGSIGLGFPIIINRQVTGIVLTVLSLDWLEQRITNRRPRGALDVLVIDDHGTVLARAGRQATRPGTNIGGSALVKAMLAQERGEGIFRLAHRRVLAAFDAVPRSAENMRVAVSVRP